METGSADPCSPSNCMSQGPSTHSLYTDVPGLVATVRELTHLQTKSPDRIQPPPTPHRQSRCQPSFSQHPENCEEGWDGREVQPCCYILQSSPWPRARLWVPGLNRYPRGHLVHLMPWIDPARLHRRHHLHLHTDISKHIYAYPLVPITAP